MSTTRLLVQSLLHYWRTNLAVVAGVVVASAVIGGALIVGDSVRDSLRQMTLERLGEIDYALNSHRFLTEEAISKFPEEPAFQERFDAIAPGLLMQGSLVHASGAADATTRRSGHVDVYGIDERFWAMYRSPAVEPPQNQDVVLSSRAAHELGVVPGDAVTLWVELPSNIPRDQLLSPESEQPAQEVSLVVSAVLPEDSGLGRLQLDPNQQLPANAFVSLDTLQSALGLAEVPPSRRHPQGTPARVNTYFVSARDPSVAAHVDVAQVHAAVLDDLLQKHMTLADLSLRLVRHPERYYLSLESAQMILEPEVVATARRAAEELSLEHSPVLVYLVNEISNAADPQKFSMYSIVAGVGSSQRGEPQDELPQTAPFGPYRFQSRGTNRPLRKREIFVNEWLAEDLGVKVGDMVALKYFEVGNHGELPEQEVTFTVAGVLELGDSAAADPGLTPQVPGITDADRFADWDQPFEMNLDRVTPRDEQYWEMYRATPKALVSLETAQDLWRSRYGQLTSFRVPQFTGATLDQTARLFEGEFTEALRLERLALFFRPVKAQGLAASAGTTDFSGLFFGFSFFLILSAAILINLLFRLGLERRVRNIGLITAVGFTQQQVRRLFLMEGLLVVFLGALVGTAAAVGYASLMVYGLKTWWIGAIGTRFLYVSVVPMSLVAGFIVSMSIALAALWWGFHGFRGISTRELLSGMAEASLSAKAQRGRSRRAAIIAGVAFAIAGALVLLSVARLIPRSEAFSGISWQSVAFFIVGIAMLTGCLAALSAWLDADKTMAVRGSGLAAVGRLSLRNASRHRQRSVLSTSLIASATFVIVAVAAGHRNPATETPDFDSGNGGYTLVAESTTPILYDLNTAAGRDKAVFIGGASQDNQHLLEDMQVMAFRMQPGENASCLNIYRTMVPTILGVPQALIDRGGFKFADTPGKNPWTRLNARLDGARIPAMGDLNTLQYSLHKGVGDTVVLPLPGEPPNNPNLAGRPRMPGGLPEVETPPIELEIVGMLDSSVFQGVLLISEANFQMLFPEQAGYRYFLIEVDPQNAAELSELLESGLTAYGFDAERVVDRLAGFLAVQNTYLSTFQTLGGLGLLLGTVGLATVMLRNVLERRSEIALMRAVGFVRNDLAGMILFENAFLLGWGLLTGTLSALLAMLPHLTTTGADVPWLGLATILASVFAIGMIASLLAITAAVRMPLLAALRAD